MKVYLITRWGNDKSGPNEADTNYIVIAKDYQDATEIVDEELSKVDKCIVDKFCHRVTELGASESTMNRAKIVLGPSIENALYHDDICIPDERKWVRDSVDEGWGKYSDYY